MLGGLLYNRSLLVSELIGNWRAGPAGGPGSKGPASPQAYSTTFEKPEPDN